MRKHGPFWTGAARPDRGSDRARGLEPPARRQGARCILRRARGSNDVVSTPGDRPLVLGLRGTTGVHAPNTPAALSAAFAEGADGVVVDVDITADGEAVACDDRWLRAFGGGPTRVADVTTAALQSLGVLTVAQVVDRFASRGLVGLWLHPRAERDALESRVRAIGTAVSGSSTWVIGSEIDELVRLGAKSSGLRCFVRGAALDDGLAPRGIRGICRPVRLGPPPPWMRHEGTLVIGTDCETPAALRPALGGGFDALLSERPGWLALRIAAIGSLSSQSTAS